MSRSSRQAAQVNRERAVVEAARIFRERGVDRTGVADVMASIGLTHGAFYSQFGSKEDLAAQACAQAFTQTTNSWLSRIEQGSEPPGQILANVIGSYLSLRHRDEPGTGCPGAALATDVARQPSDSPLREAFAAGISGMVSALGDMAPASLSPATRRDRALVTLATMLGAVTLARATSGDALSEDMLEAVRKALVKDRRQFVRSVEAEHDGA